MVNIIMYHYVRDSRDSKYPRIKSLDLTAFSRQLDYLTRNFSFTTAEEVIRASKDRTELPTHSVWLTFDDGYIDHYQYVFPELVKRGIQGSFFVPSMPVTHGKLLDVNGIHYLLASKAKIGTLLESLDSNLRLRGYTSDMLDALKAQFWRPSRFDTEEVVYFKRVLQTGLKTAERTAIISVLIQEFLGVEMTELARETYLSMSQIAEMRAHGMFFGGHGHEHVWLENSSESQQRFEIHQSHEFVQEIGMPKEHWVMCYPYGSSNSETHAILAKADASLGLTTRVGHASLAQGDPYLLPRFDTNDFPQ